MLTGDQIHYNPKSAKLQPGNSKKQVEPWFLDRMDGCPPQIRAAERLVRQESSVALRNNSPEAARLPARDDSTLAEVAEESGFSGECCFTTAFRGSVERTPGQYRRRIRRR